MKILNVGIVADVDAGKTSLAERILYDTGIIKQIGSIESGTTQLDTLTLEKKRGITIKNSYISFHYNDAKINLIDTPGHLEFIDEVESVFEVLDVVILVVSALDGIKSQTKRMWRAIQSYGKPCIIFINKLDLFMGDITKLKQQIEILLSPQIIHQNPSAAFDNTLLLHDLLEDELYTLAENDEAIEMALLSELPLTQTMLQQSITRQFQAQQITPIVLGSAKQGAGIKPILTLLSQINPATSTSKLAGYIYKITHDERFGKGVYMKLQAGTITTKSTLQITNPNGNIIEEKIAMMQQIQNGKAVNVNEINAGDIAILYGLNSATTGSTLGDYNKNAYKPTPALYNVTLHNADGNIIALKKAVFELSEEHPSITAEWFEETNELQLNVMGKLQAEVIIDELTERYQLAVTITEPKIIYRETPTITAIGFEAYTMPKPSWAIVTLEISPLPRGAGIIYKNEFNNDEILPRYHAQVENSIRRALKQGRFGWEVVDLQIRAIKGESHKMHTHPLDFSLASPIALQDALSKAKMQVLEPLILYKLTVPNTLAPTVMSDIFMIEGTVQKQNFSEYITEIEVLAPLATSIDYPITFLNTTKGEGLLEQQFYGYFDCPEARVTSNPRQGIDPLDRDKWILHHRGGMTKILS